MKIMIPGTENEIIAEWEIKHNKIVKCYLTDDNLLDYNELKTFVGTAKCHDDDKFDAIVGKRLALQRALEKREITYNSLTLELQVQILNDKIKGREQLFRKFDKRYKRK